MLYAWLTIAIWQRFSRGLTGCLSIQRPFDEGGYWQRNGGKEMGVSATGAGAEILGGRNIRHHLSVTANFTDHLYRQLRLRVKLPNRQLRKTRK